MYLNTSGHLFYLYGQKSTGKMHSCFLSRKTIQKARAISSSRNYLPRVVGGSEVKVSYEILYAEFGSWKMWSHPELHATFQLVCDCNHGKKKEKAIRLDSSPHVLAEVNQSSCDDGAFFQFTTNEAEKRSFRKPFYDRVWLLCHSAAHISRS